HKALTTARSALTASVDEHAAIGRALVRLGDVDGAQDAFARAHAVAGHDVEKLKRVISDQLAVDEIIGVASALRLAGMPMAFSMRSLYVDFLRGLYGVGRLDVGLELMGQGDVVERYEILYALLDAPLQTGDADGCMMLVRAAPRAYQGDLLRALVPRMMAQGMSRAARRAVDYWDTVEPSGIARLGARALVGDVDEARTALKQKLAERLAVEEVAFPDAWAYRELGRACGWAGELSGALSALERVADHEDRLHALISAARHAPSVVAEVMLCAARGLVISVEDERRQADAAARFGVLLVRLGRIEEAQTTFHDATQKAAAIRRPRSDQGFVRRSALHTLVRAQLAVGQHPGAFRTIRKLRTRRQRGPLLAEIATIYAQAGDLGGAALCLDGMDADAAQVRATIDALSAWLQAGRPVCQETHDAA
ncbi:MAG: hypothetical protein AAFV53_31385, partial [Myxococcota bacterium]